ncbi:hypothetical protein CX676_10890 [Paracoccus zhejiangensis]|uniref:Uncharacterized protein n=2 Tax=Paracoccus zhejiangensis TaxID=1077935 RepID=A0A2H5EZ81_9RHOB|nr:hypothetical protein CX676_10890 [Paracoccus zhejiangensis]
MIGCLGGDWTPAFGDRGVLAWITVLAYLACAALSVAVWRGVDQRALRRFWGAMAIVMLFLAVNKQLDLQTALNETGRCISMAQGWHDYRRYAQMLFIILVVVAVALVFKRGSQMMRGHMQSHWLALAGAALVCGYVLIRASSLHSVDAIGNLSVLGLSVNFLLENAGLVLIALNATRLLRLRSARRAAERAAEDERRQAEETMSQTTGMTSPRRTVGPTAGASKGEAAEAPRPFRPLKPRGH